MRMHMSAALLGAILSLQAVAATCDVEVDEHSLFTVTVDGRPFKDKRFVTYDDAVRLRDVLVYSGACRRQSELARCEVRDAGAGLFKVVRGGREFDVHSRHASYERAYADAKRLERLHLCYLE